MLVEVTVFGRDKRIDQQIWEATARHKQTLLAVWRGHHCDKARVKTEETELAVAVQVLDGFQVIAREGQTRAHLPFFTIREIERATDHLNAVRLHGEFTGPRHRRDLAILGRRQQLHHLFFADRHIRLKAHHAAINRRRKLPDFTVNAAADFLIQIDAINGHQHGKNDAQLYQEPEPAVFAARFLALSAAFTRARLFIVIAIIIIIVVILIISELSTAYLLLCRTCRLAFTSNRLAVIPRHAFSPQHSGIKA